MDKKDTIINFIKKKGPAIPGQIYQKLEQDILMTSALMSEMKQDGQLLVSSVKIGGSPLYYLEGQEAQLEQYIDKLHEKEKKAALLLKERKVLRDKSLEPVARVALRKTKDFAKPIYAKINGQKELFWKWYLFRDKEAVKKRVLSMVGGGRRDSENGKKSEGKAKKPEKKKTETKKSSEEKDEKKEKKAQNPERNQNGAEKEEENKKIGDGTQLANKAEKIFDRLNVDVLDWKAVRKNKDYEFIVKIPSAVGKMKYYCKLVSKKRVNDKDLSTAFANGHLKKLPVLFLMTGSLTKKAKEILKEEFEGMSVKKINNII